MKVGQKQVLDPVQELRNVKMGGQALVNNPKEVLRVLNMINNLMNTDQFKHPSYQLTNDKNAAAVASAMAGAITDLKNKGLIKQYEIPKNPALFKQVTDAIKTSFDVKVSLKSPGRIIPSGENLAAVVPGRAKTQKYGVSFRAGNRTFDYTVSSKSPVPENPFELRQWLQKAGQNINSIAVKGETLKTRSSLDFNDRIQALVQNLNQAILERNKVSVAMK